MEARYRAPRRALLLLSLTLAATHAGTAGAAAQGGLPTDPPIAVADAKPNWRWIGERTNPSVPCPRNGLSPNWRVQPLFCAPENPANPDDEQCDLDEPIPPGLAAFCTYEWAPPSPLTPVPPAQVQRIKQLVTMGRLTTVAPDSMAVSGFGSELQDQMWKALAQRFQRQTGAPTGTPPVPFTLQPAVRLAIVDTHPTEERIADTLVANSTHGAALVNMADALLCDDKTPEGCAAVVATRLALGYICPLDRNINNPACRDVEHGGWVGTIGNLARAIRLEAREWLDDPAPGARLVINLSVAWHPRFGGLQQNPSAMPPPVRAVYAAIADAQCRGALVIAAAGNLTAGPEDQSGPLLPAAWEQRPALTQSQCTNRLGEPPPAIFPPGSDTRPFVYAAGGVRADGAPLANSRPGGEPAFVAYGDHSNVVDAAAPAPQTPTATLTGSSVAALATSAAAAYTWFAADALVTPAFKPYQVMEHLYATAVPTGREADFCRGGTNSNPCPGVAPDVREVQICTAVDALANTATCPSTGNFVLSIDDGGAREIALSTLTSELKEPGCGPVTVFYDGRLPENPCPFEQFFGPQAMPWTSPQPNDTPCPNCGTGVRRSQLTGATRTLFIEIDDARQSWVLTDATLRCGKALYKLPVDPLRPGDRITVLLDDDEPHCQPNADMFLYFIDEDARTSVDVMLDGD